MYIVDSLFIRIADDVEPSIEGFRSALAVLERGHHVTVLHDPKFPWLVVKERLDTSGDQEKKLLDDAMIAAGLGELIQITWDDEWRWTTYRHLSPGKPPRRFVLNPEPDEAQSPWIMNLGDKESWETYTDVPGDSDLQTMAAFHRLPGITHTDRLAFPDEWEFRRDLLVVGKGSAVPPTPADPNGAFGPMKRAVAGELLSIADALRLMQSGYGVLSMRHVSKAMRTHRVYAPKRRWFRKRAVLRGPEGQKLVPVLSSLDPVPGIPSDRLKRDFVPVFVMELIEQLERDEGLIFNPLQQDGSLRIDPEDIPNFQMAITSVSEWMDETVK